MNSQKVFSPVRKLLVGGVVAAGLLFSSCLDELGSLAPLDLTGTFTFIDGNKAAVLVTNQSRTVEITALSLLSSDQDAVGTAVNVTGGAAPPLSQRAMFVSPSTENLSIVVGYSAPAVQALGWEASYGVAAFSVTLPRALDRTDVLVYRALDSGEVVVRLGGNAFGPVPYPDPDPRDTGNPQFINSVGEGSIPAVIPHDAAIRISSFLVFNMSNEAVIDSVEFTSGTRSFLMGRVEMRDNHSIGLSPGQWRVTVRYRLASGGQAYETSMNKQVVRPDLPQAAQQHRLFFGLINGQLGITGDEIRDPGPAGGGAGEGNITDPPDDGNVTNPPGGEGGTDTGSGNGNVTNPGGGTDTGGGNGNVTNPGGGSSDRGPNSGGRWIQNGGQYFTGDFVFHNGQWWVALQSHLTHNDPNWAPNIAHSLWRPWNTAIDGSAPPPPNP